MKPLDYVRKYNLDKTNQFSHSDFVQDLTADFIALLELNKAEDNIKGFDNAVRCIEMKFNSIKNKTRGTFPSKLWGYFFATVIVKLREEMCSKDMEARRKQKQARRKEWEQRNAYRKWEEEQFENMNREFYEHLLSSFFRQSTKPISDFHRLSLSEHASIEEVKQSFKQLSHKYHPDKGGKAEDFIEIVNAKNRCINWLIENK